MIVLDEQLQGRGLEAAIGRWYPGTVCFINELRPHGIVKDDAVPTLLSRLSEPTFVTINASDFWRKVGITGRFCVICVSIPDELALATNDILRRVLRHERLRTKAQRMGMVVLASPVAAQYYTAQDDAVRSL